MKQGHLVVSVGMEVCYSAGKTIESVQRRTCVCVHVVEQTATIQPVSVYILFPLRLCVAVI